MTPQQQPPPHQHGENANWIQHVGWQMEGVDTNFDTSIDRQLSALGNTLTGLTGSEEEDFTDQQYDEGKLLLQYKMLKLSFQFLKI